MGTVDNIQRAQPHLGTFVEICSGGRNRAVTERAIDAAFAEIAKVHRLMSFHNVDSDVSRLNRDAYGKSVVVNAWTYQVLETALDVGRNSLGAFDISIAAALQRLGRLPRHAWDWDQRRPQTPANDTIVLLSGNRVRFRSAATRIDLGGIAKGFAVDRALDVLRKHDQLHGLVNAGGDLATFGVRPHTIHIRHPNSPHHSVCQVSIENAALASSACWLDLIHDNGPALASIIDPMRQKPANDVAGASVRAPSCMIADALTKCVMIAGQHTVMLLKKYHASALLVLRSGETLMTTEWQNAISAAA